MTEVTNHYLLLYRLDARSVSVEDFGTDGQAATTAYSEREREYAGDPNVEVVLVGADSLDTIRKTHSHYFGGDDLLATLERHLVIASSAS